MLATLAGGTTLADLDMRVQSNKRTTSQTTEDDSDVTPSNNAVSDKMAKLNRVGEACCLPPDDQAADFVGTIQLTSRRALCTMPHYRWPDDSDKILFLSPMTVSIPNRFMRCVCMQW